MNNTKFIEYRRDVLRQIKCSNDSHAGLWLDRYLPGKGVIDSKDTDARTAHVAQVAALAVPEAYHRFYTRWEMQLGLLGAQCLKATVRGRMAVGHGAKATLETSIALHRTYGVPYIPGSALKGVAASFARQQLVGWESTSDPYIAMFGSTTSAGHVIFYDALYVPNSALGNMPLHRDVLTPHHSAYNGGAPDAPPADWDDPIPVPFLSATGGYLVATGGPTEWPNKALDILRLALAECGIGAKTSSGYGRMDWADRQPPPPPLGQSEARQLIKEIQALHRTQVPQSLDKFVQRWQKLEAAPVLRIEVAQALIGKVREVGRERNWAEKPWFQELLQAIKE